MAGVKVYKVEDGTYVLVDEAEAEKIKALDDLKGQNLLLSIAGAGLAIPAVIVTAPQMAIILSGGGAVVAVKTIINNDRIRQLEERPIDFRYLLDQGLAVPAALFPMGSLVARTGKIPLGAVQTIDGIGTSYGLATGPASVLLAAVDRKDYYIDRGIDPNYESWRIALQKRNEQEQGPGSYYRDALSYYIAKKLSESSGGNYSDAGLRNKASTVNEPIRETNDEDANTTTNKSDSGEGNDLSIKKLTTENTSQRWFLNNPEAREFVMSFQSGANLAGVNNSTIALKSPAPEAPKVTLQIEDWVYQAAQQDSESNWWRDSNSSSSDGLVITGDS